MQPTIEFPLRPGGQDLLNAYVEAKLRLGAYVELLSTHQEPCYVWKHKSPVISHCGVRRTVRRMVYERCVEQLPLDTDQEAFSVQQRCPTRGKDGQRRVCIQPRHLYLSVLQAEVAERRGDDDIFDLYASLPGSPTCLFPPPSPSLSLASSSSDFLSPPPTPLSSFSSSSSSSVVSSLASSACSTSSFSSAASHQRRLHRERRGRKEGFRLEFAEVLTPETASAGGSKRKLRTSVLGNICETPPYEATPLLPEFCNSQDLPLCSTPPPSSHCCGADTEGEPKTGPTG